MAMSLTDGTTTLVLPPLDWVDEYAWQPVQQSVEYSLTGAIIVEQSTRLAGRPITLSQGSQNTAFGTKAMLDQLRAWSEIPGQQLTLTLLDGRVFTVVFRHRDGAIDARPMLGARSYPESSDDYWRITIRLMAV